MTQRSNDPNPFDPFGNWQAFRDANLDTWAKVMMQLVNSDAYSQATAQMLDTYLTTSAPFRRALETAMTQVLTQLNMPVRADVIGVAERLTNIEMRLDDLDAKLQTIERLAQQTPASQAPDQPSGAEEEH